MTVQRSRFTFHSNSLLGSGCSLHEALVQVSLEQSILVSHREPSEKLPLTVIPSSFFSNDQMSIIVLYFISHPDLQRLFCQSMWACWLYVFFTVRKNPKRIIFLTRKLSCTNVFSTQSWYVLKSI